MRRDLVEAAAIGEVGLVGLRPATECLVDGEQVQLRELPGIFGLRLLRDRGAIEILARDVLAFFGVQVAQVLLGDRTRALAVHVPVDHGDRRLGQDARRRVHDVDLAAELLAQQIRFVLP